MLKCWRASALRTTVDGDFLKFEINLIYLRRTVRSDTMNGASCLQQSSNSCDVYETPLSSLGYYQHQVDFTSFSLF